MTSDSNDREESLSYNEGLEKSITESNQHASPFTALPFIILRGITGAMAIIHRDELSKISVLSTNILIVDKFYGLGPNAIVALGGYGYIKIGYEAVQKAVQTNDIERGFAGAFNLLGGLGILTNAAAVTVTIFQKELYQNLFTCLNGHRENIVNCSTAVEAIHFVKEAKDTLSSCINNTAENILYCSHNKTATILKVNDYREIINSYYTAADIANVSTKVVWVLLSTKAFYDLGKNIYNLKRIIKNNNILNQALLLEDLNIKKERRIIRKMERLYKIKKVDRIEATAVTTVYGIALIGGILYVMNLAPIEISLIFYTGIGSLPQIASIFITLRNNYLTQEDRLNKGFFSNCLKVCSGIGCDIKNKFCSGSKNDNSPSDESNKYTAKKIYEVLNKCDIDTLINIAVKIKLIDIEEEFSKEDLLSKFEAYLAY